MMNFHILTLFPEMVMQGLHTSILGRAVEREYISIEAVNIRDYTMDKHGKVDDYTYGGGAGMLMQAQPVYDAYMAVREKIAVRQNHGGDTDGQPDGICRKDTRVIYVTPQGKTFHQALAQELAGEEDLIFLCGHYEGIDIYRRLCSDGRRTSGNGNDRCHCEISARCSAQYGLGGDRIFR